MNVLYDSDPTRYETMTTAELRRSYLLDGLFAPGEVVLHYWLADRAVVGSIVPLESALALPCPKELAAQYFAERRELGVINIGGPGRIRVDGRDFSLERLDCLYIGRDTKDIVFSSARSTEPARFYLVSYPAHQSHPTTLVSRDQAEKQELGTRDEANERTINRCIHLAGIKSCQLVMGFTQLRPGSVWNTMPPHTHARRSEIYFYFDLEPHAAALHLMGRPDATRSIVVHDQQAVLSPSWSIHAAAGTSNYTFIWAMGGENQVFADMDPAPVAELR